MLPVPEQPPRVFVSYSRDSPEHADRVLALADRLRGDGVDAALDQYEVSPPDGWPLWMDKQIRDSDFVLMVCTPTYFRLVMGEGVTEADRDVVWEANGIRSALYGADGLNTRFVPVLMDGGTFADIPAFVQGSTICTLTGPDGYDSLLRRLSGQAPAQRPPLGLRPRATDFFRFWNVPQARNPFFTGQEDILSRLEPALAAGRPVALCGLGGMGKTQTAVEYAYRHRDEYQAVLWANASSEAALRESFVQIARLLRLTKPEDETQKDDGSRAVAAALGWLGDNDGWLLILDNADDLSAAKPYLPSPLRGHVLLTTRAFATGAVAEALPLGSLPENDGALLLLRRAKRVAEDAPLNAANADDREAALAISRAVDGLPLALDQAGAFIEETSGSPALYLELYQAQSAEMLAEYGDPKDRDHASVQVTFTLAFAKVAEASPAAGELVRCCAFLAPDAIPEEIFTGAETALNAGDGPFGVSGLAWEKIVRDACRYSLLSRRADSRTLGIHRLVQTVTRQETDETQRQAYTRRLVEAVNAAFPLGEFPDWPECERLLPHARVCCEFIRADGLASDSAWRLLMQVGQYLSERGLTAEAAPLFDQALALARRTAGPGNPRTAQSVSGRGMLYWEEGKYAADAGDYRTADAQYRLAEPLLVEALSIREAVLEPDHLDTAQSFNDLGLLYKSWERYDQAEPLYARALAIREAKLGPKHPDTITSLNNLAELRRVQGRFTEAMPLFEQALAASLEVLGPDDPGTALSYNNLAGIYVALGDFPSAEPPARQALTIFEKSLGPNHPRTITTRKNYAYVLSKLPPKPPNPQ